MKTAGQELLPCGSRDKAEAWRGVMRGPLSVQVTFRLCLGSRLHKQELVRGHLALNRHIILSPLSKGNLRACFCMCGLFKPQEGWM